MHELVIDAESDQGVPVFVHVAAFSHVCDVVLYLQTPAEPKSGRLAEISRGPGTMYSSARRFLTRLRGGRSG
jgi:hypothetical protein